MFYLVKGEYNTPRPAPPEAPKPDVWDPCGAAGGGANSGWGSHRTMSMRALGECGGFGLRIGGLMWDQGPALRVQG